MTTKARKLLDDALKLPRRERANLAAQLWNSLDAQEWLKEIDTRADDLKHGRVKGIPLAKALEDLGKPASTES